MSTPPTLQNLANGIEAEPGPNAPAQARPANHGNRENGDLRKKLSKLMPSRPEPANAPSVPETPTRGETNQPKTTVATQPQATKSAANPSTPARQPQPRKQGGATASTTGQAALKDGRIMIIDDEETNILTVEAYLKQAGYKDFLSTVDSRQALVQIQEHHPDLILLDINMPNVSGIDILRALSMDPRVRHIPVIVLTAATNQDVKRQALSLGAADFLTKPVDPHDLIPRVRNSLIIKQHMDSMSNQNAKLEELVKRRTKDLFDSRQQLILSLARAAEHRDDDTGNHVIRVGRYAGLIAQELGWPEQRVQLIEQAAQLHDVGKIGIPDSILFKPGKLDPDEWKIMREHCAMGVEIIEPMGGKDLEQMRSHASLGAEILHIRSSPMMMMATRIAQTHHERWDGTGYPLGLAGEDIPIEGRITAVADVFDAVSSARPYKPAFPREKCFSILTEGRGSHFDPQVLDAFFACSDEIIDVQLRLMDRPSS